MTELTSPEGLSGLWRKKEGKPIILTTIALLGVGLYWALPALISFATNLLHLAFLGAGLALVLFTILDDDLRTKFWFFYKSLIRTLFGWFIALNPEAILKTHLDYLNKQLQTFKTSVATLMGHRRTLMNQIEKDTEEATASKELAEAALKPKNPKRAPDIATSTAKMYQVGQLLAATEKNKKLLSNINVILAIFEKTQRATEIMIEKTNFDIRMMLTQSKIGDAVVKSIKSSTAILFGNTAERAIYEQAVDKLQTKIAMEQGAYDKFTQDMEPYLKGLDLEQGIMEDKAMSLLQNWDAEVLPKLLGEPAIPKYDLNSLNTPAIADASYVEVRSNNAGSNLLNK